MLMADASDAVMYEEMPVPNGEWEDFLLIRVHTNRLTLSSLFR